MNYYGIDIGGTNLRIAQIDPINGELLSKIYAFEFKNIKTNKDLNEIIFNILPKNNDFIVGVSIAAAIDLKKQKIIECFINSIYSNEGKFEFLTLLKKRKIKVFI